MNRSMTRNAPLIVLRSFRENDLDFFTSLAQDERVTRFVGDGRPWTPDRIDERGQLALREDPMDQLGAARWFIAEENGRPVGLLVSSRVQDSIEIGYWVAPRHWGRGVAGAMLDRAVETLPGLYAINRLSARVSPSNHASARALTRRSFNHVGRHDGLDIYSRD